MNISQHRENAHRLVEYELTGEVGQKEKRNLTVNISEAYHGALQRLSLVQGMSKAAIIRQALDHLCDMIGRKALYQETRNKV